VLFHFFDDFEENLDCLTMTPALPEGNISILTGEAYAIRWVHNFHSFFTAIFEDKSI
jgi:hypothetical protein